MNTQTKSIRMSRIFQADNKALIVAIDHPPQFWVKTPPGLSNPGQVMEKLVQGNADAILASPGVHVRFAPPFAKKLGLIASVPTNPKIVEGVAKTGVDALKTTHFISPEELRAPGTPNMLLEFSLECKKHGIPFLCEIVPMDKEKGELLLDADEIATAVRIAAEQGADIVKTSYPGDAEGFKKVTSMCPVPVVILGGAKTKDERAIFTMVHDAISAGGAGVALGRNVWRYSEPALLVRALGSIIHDNASVDEALKVLGK